MMVKKTNKKKPALGLKIDMTIINTYFLTALIGAGLLFNGYFFTHQSLAVNIITGAFFLIVMAIYVNKKEFYYDRPVFLLGLGFLFLSLVGLPFASNIREALQDILLNATSLMVFLLAVQAFYKEKNKHIFLKGFYWSAILITLIGLISFIFGVNILNSYQNDNRLITTLGYANTAALLLTIVFFIGIYLKKATEAKGYLYIFANCSLLLTFLATKSRGGLLLIIGVLVVYYLLQNKHERLDTIKETLYVIIPSIIAFPIFFNTSFFARDTKGIVLSIAVIAILLTYSYYIEKIRITKKTIYYSGAIILLFTVGTLTFLGGDSQVVNSVINNDAIERLKTINFQQQQVQERFIFASDALQIAKDHLLLGTGGGGWPAEYRQYQTFRYNTTEVHNHYVQVLVENGIIGFAIFITLWILLFINLYKKFRKARSLQNITITVIVLSIFLHSMIDFNLSYPVFISLWWILIAMSLDKEELQKVTLDNKLLISISSVFIIMLILVNSSLTIGLSYGNEATRHMRHNNLEGTKTNFEKSLNFDPINSTYLANLSQIYSIEELNTESSSSNTKALETLNKAIKYKPNDYEWYILKTRYLLKIRQYEEAYQVALTAISKAPWVELVYYDTARFFIEKQEENPEVVEYAQAIIDLAKDRTESIEEKHLNWWHGSVPYSERIKVLEEEL